MADISRDLFDKEKHQDKVIFQQTKLPLTCEFNLFEDIYSNRGLDYTQLSVNDNYVGDSFKVIPSTNSNEVIIQQGTFYHLGKPIQIFSDVSIAGLNTPVTNRIDTVFVEWYLEEIGAIQDPTIVDTILNFETTRQLRINFTINVAEGSDLPVPNPNTNFFTVAKLNRLSGNASITESMIQDERDKVVYNYVTSGCLVEDAGGLDISITEGEGFVSNTYFYLESSTPTISLAPSATSYIYTADVSGYVQVQVSGFEPIGYHVLLAEVVTDATSIIIIEDKRIFRPITWRYKYSSDYGRTGYPVLSQKYKAGEDISKGDLVYFSSNKIVKKASATGLLPCIGIAPKGIPSGKIGDIVTIGEIAYSGWNWVPGKILFLDTTLGGLTQTAPFALNNSIQRVGIAITDTLIYIQADLVTIEVKELNNSAPLVFLDNQFQNSIATTPLSLGRLTLILPEENSTPNRTFTIQDGTYLWNDTEYRNFSISNPVDLGPGGAFQTSAIPSNWYNKATFTAREDNFLQMYEGVANSSLGSVLDPSIPANELPIVLVYFQDDGSASPGTIYPITSSNITDLRNFLNLGSIDNVPFKPVYRDSNNFIIQKGSEWFGTSYLTLSTNLTVSGDVSTNSTYYIYLDYVNATGAVTTSSFVTLTASLDSTDLRKYFPFGQYSVVGGAIQRNSFISYNSRFWEYRSTKIEDSFITPLIGQTIFNTSFNFVNGDYLDTKIGGFKVFEGNDFIKTPPNTVTFNYLVKKNSEVRIRKI